MESFIKFITSYTEQFVLLVLILASGWVAMAFLSLYIYLGRLA